MTVTPRRFRRRAVRNLAAVCGVCVLATSGGSTPPQIAAPSLHYAPNHNFDAAHAYVPGKAGFNLADVSNADQLKTLPAGVKALVWVGQCAGADARFIATVTPFLGRKNVFGFYLMDDPDPRAGGQHCAPDALKAESDWIHSHFPGAITFIVPMNMASAYNPSFQRTYNPANSHVDLFGIDPYPCRTEAGGCDYAMIGRYVLAAEASGIPRSRMIPVYQAFGGGAWDDGEGGKYTLPTTSQLGEMVARWRALIPAPVFDYAYSWGTQKDDQALENSPELRDAFASHNRVSHERD